MVTRRQKIKIVLRNNSAQNYRRQSRQKLKSSLFDFLIITLIKKLLRRRTDSQSDYGLGCLTAISINQSINQSTNRFISGRKAHYRNIKSTHIHTHIQTRFTHTYTVLSEVDDCYFLESRSICLKFYFLESKSSFKIFYFLESRK